MFFSFLALMVRAFIWCWSRLTWKIMSTWCRFSMLGQQDRTHSSICCTDRFRKLELFERYKTSVRTPRNFDHMCKAPARPDLYQLISAPSFNWKLLKVKTNEILKSVIFSTIFLTLKIILWISFGNVGKKRRTPLWKRTKILDPPKHIKD